MDDLTDRVASQDAARLLNACRAVMVVGWLLIAVVAVLVVETIRHPNGNFASWAVLAIPILIMYFLLSTRCPRCGRMFFAEKTGVGPFIGRFSCVACGYQPGRTNSNTNLQ